MMLDLDYAEFNITNVCNLNCPDCVTYNNFSFRGHSRWLQQQDIYESWSQQLNIRRITVVGGEPMLNPDFDIWVRGLRRLWPQSHMQIFTNGTQIARWPELRQLLLDTGAVLRVSAHGHANRAGVLAQISEILHGDPIISYDITQHELDSWQASYNIIRDKSWPDCADPREFSQLPAAVQQECRQVHDLDGDAWLRRCWQQTWRDKQGVTVIVLLSHRFLPSAVHRHPTRGTWTLYNSDPKKSIEVCCGRWVPTFVNGLLHKCSTVALLPEFLRQFELDISEEERALIRSYLPASSKDEPITISRFVEDLRRGEAIQQCRFCSESGEVGQQFEATTKKMRFYAKSV
jgi:organic radical activating enzyme